MRPTFLTHLRTASPEFPRRIEPTGRTRSFEPERGDQMILQDAVPPLDAAGDGDALPVEPRGMAAPDPLLRRRARPTPRGASRHTVPPDDVPPEEAHQIGRLFAWIRTCGGYIGPVQAKRAAGLRGLHAADSVDRNTPLLHVPPQLVVDAQVARSSVLGQRLIEADPHLDGRALLAAFLIDARARGGFWSPWIDMLPTDFPGHPLFFSDQELAAMDDWSEHRWMILAARSAADDAYARFASCLPPDAACSRGDFQWAFTCVLTRAFRRIEGDGVQWLLAPGVDLFNHEQHALADVSVDPQGGFAVQADSAVAASEPIAIGYGEFSNALLLATHGFCLQGNPFDQAVLPVGDACLLLPAQASGETLSQLLARFGAVTESDGAVGDVRTRFQEACLQRALGLSARADAAPHTAGGRQIAVVLRDEARLLQRYATLGALHQAPAAVVR